MRTPQKTSPPVQPQRNSCRARPVRVPRFQPGHAAIFLSLPTLLLTLGCASTTNRDTLPTQEETRAVLSPTPPNRPAQVAPTQPAESNGWAVVLLSINEGARRLAPDALQRVRTQGGFPDAQLRELPRGVAIVVGSFTDPTSPEAQAALQRVRQTQVEGGRPYAAAYLMPPSGGEGSMPQYDLRNAREEFGEDAVYSLQIGVYGRTDGRRPTPEELAQFRQAAEQAVAALRRDGELAFYFHGPIRSTVTVGVLSERDHDPSFVPALESNVLRDLRERFPHNLVNGAGVRETIRTTAGPKERLQPSALVAIPK